MALPLVQGRIVWATVPDPQGRNEKKRRCVIVSENAEIAASDRIKIVGITHTFIESDREFYVELQYGPNALSSLSEPSAAHCNWVIELSKSSVTAHRGFLRPEFVERILDKLDVYRDRLNVIQLE